MLRRLVVSLGFLWGLIEGQSVCVMAVRSLASVYVYEARKLIFLHCHHRHGPLVDVSEADGFGCGDCGPESTGACKSCTPSIGCSGCRDNGGLCNGCTYTTTQVPNEKEEVVFYGKLKVGIIKAADNVVAAAVPSKSKRPEPIRYS